MRPVVHVNRLEEWPGFAALEPRVRSAANLALAAGGPDAARGGGAPNVAAERVADLSITFLPDAEIRELNRAWLGRDRPTDVIAFPLPDAGAHAPSEAVLGDIYISFDAAQRQAAERGIRPEEELLRLVIHGTLHVLGHDHPEGPDREDSAMFRLQEALLRQL